MRILQVIFFSLVSVFLSGCQTIAGVGNDEVTPQARSNEVAESNYNLGIAYLGRGEYERALEKLNRALSADPNYALTHNALGVLYQNIGKTGQAEEYFNNAIRLAPNDGSILNTYGSFLCSQKRYDEAMAVYEKAAKNPLYDSPEIAITNAGICELDNNNTQQAEQLFKRALDINPKVPLALIHMSQFSYDQSNYLSARGYLQRYLAIAPHTPRSLWLGIQIEKELGDKNSLSSYALILRNKYPDSQEAQFLQQSGLK